MARIVLIHGGWMGAWCWEKLTPLLDQAGHQVTTIDLPGHGEDPTPAHEANMTGYVSKVCAVLADLDGPAHLLGHGMGGLVITQVAELMPDRVISLIYLAALIAPPGEAGPPIGQDSALPAAREFSDDACTMTVNPGAITDVFFADCADNDIAQAKQRMVPLSTDMMPAGRDQPVRHWPQIPRSYISCRDDRLLPLSMQHQMITDTGFDHVVEMATSHSPFYSAPEDLARHIAHLTGQYRRPAMLVNCHPDQPSI